MRGASESILRFLLIKIFAYPMKSSLEAKLRCPKTKMPLRRASVDERILLKLGEGDDAYVTSDKKYYYLIDQGLAYLLPTSAREFPSRG